MPKAKAIISLQWDPGELEQVDAAARVAGESRSEFVRRAALDRALALRTKQPKGERG